MANMEEEIIKAAVEVGKEIAVEVYKDGLSPSVKATGEVLSFLPRTLRVLLSGWEKWIINGEESVKLAAEAIREKVREIPEDKLTEPEAHVAIPAIQQLCYCQDSEELRNMYANLLTSSMNMDKKWQVHPAFVDIIKQLCPDEAKFLKALQPIEIISYPLIDVAFTTGLNAKGEHIIITNFTNINIDILEHPQSICAYIDNLVRLNIIEIPAGTHLVDMKNYEPLETHPLIKEATKDNEYMKHHFKHKMFRLTNFGVNFVKVVVRD